MPGIAMPTLTIAILSNQCLVWYGLQKILECSLTVPMVAHPYQWRTTEMLAQTRTDVVILDLETECDVINTNKDIAHQLSISDSTVRHHMTSIFDKVGMPNRQKLLVHAHQFRTTPV